LYDQIPGRDVTEGATAGTLFVVSTPIGNMGDFSFRAVEVLKSVSAVLAEDTRHTRHLLERYDIATSAVAYHEHNEAKTTPGLGRTSFGGRLAGAGVGRWNAAHLRSGVAIGGRRSGSRVPVVPIPGASALLAALVASGLDVGRFTFFGFLTRTGK